MRVLFPPAPKLQKYYTVEEAVVVALCDRIVATGRPIMSMLRLKSNLGWTFPPGDSTWRVTQKKKLCSMVYIWVALELDLLPPLSGMTISNHPTAEAWYPLLFQEWTKTQVDLGMLVGPASREQLPWRNLTTIPLHTVDKDVKLGTRRICADPSYTPPGWPKAWSLNAVSRKIIMPGNPSLTPFLLR